MTRILLIAALLCGLGVGYATAARPATSGERQKITREVRPFISANSAPGMTFAISRVRISIVNPTWARLQVSNPSVGVADVVARKVKGAWRGVVLGSNGVGCRIPSRAVRADLALSC